MLHKLLLLSRRRTVRLALNGVVVIAVFFGIGLWQTRGHLRGDAPAFSLPTLDGATVSTQSLAGKPTMLVFWAPWCGVCKLESGNVSWVRSLVGAHANVVSVASEYGDLAEVRAYVAEQGVDYPVLLGGKATARAFAVAAFPTVFFLDGQGRITGSAVGYTTTLGLLTRLLF